MYSGLNFYSRINKTLEDKIGKNVRQTHCNLPAGKKKVKTLEVIKHSIFSQNQPIILKNN